MCLWTNLASARTLEIWHCSTSHCPRKCRSSATGVTVREQYWKQLFWNTGVSFSQKAARPSTRSQEGKTLSRGLRIRESAECGSSFMSKPSSNYLSFCRGHGIHGRFVQMIFHTSGTSSGLRTFDEDCNAFVGVLRCTLRDSFASEAFKKTIHWSHRLHPQHAREQKTLLC